MLVLRESAPELCTYLNAEYERAKEGAAAPSLALAAAAAVAADTRNF